MEAASGLPDAAFFNSNNYLCRDTENRPGWRGRDGAGTVLGTVPSAVRDGSGRSDGLILFASDIMRMSTVPYTV